jgi:hypothetical protein
MYGLSAARVWRRPFVKARAFWVEEALPAMALGTCREPLFFSSFEDGPLDAPGLIPAGGMRSEFEAGWVRVLAVERGQ